MTIWAGHPFAEPPVRVRDEYGRRLCTCGRPEEVHRS